MSRDPRIGVFVCHSADSALGPVDLQAVADYAEVLPGVVLARVVLDGRALHPEVLSEQLRQAGLKTLVVAGWTPGFFKGAFAAAFVQVGGDPARIRLASFREHGATGARALERARAVVACAVRNVPFGLAA